LQNGENQIQNRSEEKVRGKVIPSRKSQEHGEKEGYRQETIQILDRSERLSSLNSVLEERQVLPRSAVKRSQMDDQ
jgi:hypothetical protein